MEEIYLIDYTTQLDDITQELINVREFQKIQINNMVNMVEVSFVFVGLIIACIIGLGFIKVAFKK